MHILPLSGAGGSLRRTVKTTSNSRRKHHRAAMLCLIATLGSVLSARPLLAEQPYRSGSGDILAISVFGQDKLSGQFKISADGKISYPVLGSIEVVNLTRSETELLIRQRLAEQLPGAGRVSVDVAEYAPVFVLGDVEKPGRYEFRPGMIALELLALGGGTKRAMLDPNNNATLRLLSLEQEISDLRLIRFSQAVTRARLEAETNSQNYDGAIAASDDQPIMQSRKQKILDDEKKIFRVRADVLKNREVALRQQYDSFDAEIASLTQSIALYNDELKMVGQEVNTIQGLVDRGLATETKSLVAKRELSATKRNVLELQSFLARARQHQLAVGLQIDELHHTQASELAKSLRDLDIDIARTDEKLAMVTNSLAALIPEGHVGSSPTERVSINFDVIRLLDGKYRTVQLTERDYLEPRDIVQVSRLLTDQAASGPVVSGGAAATAAAAQQIRTQ